MQMPPFRAFKACLIEQCADGKGLVEPIGPSATARIQRETASVQSIAFGNDDIEPFGGELVPRPIGPLDQREAFTDSFGEADFDELIRIGQAIEVEMVNWKASRFVALQQREGGAGAPPDQGRWRGGGQWRAQRRSCPCPRSP